MLIRKITFHVHLYAGMLAGLLLLVTGLSGSLIVFADEADAFLNEAAFRVAERDGGVSLQTALDGVRKAYPGEVPTVFYPAHDKGETHRFMLRSKAGLRLVSVDPHDGAITATRFRDQTFVGWTRDLHVQILSGRNGETAVGVGGGLLFALCVSGLIVWFPKPGRHFSEGLKIQWGAGRKRQTHDLHRAGGFFALVLLTVTAVTGVALVFDDAAGKAVSFLTRSPARLARPEAKTSGFALPLDDLRNRAEAALPGGQLTVILFPRNQRESIGFRKRFAEDWHHTGRSFVYLAPDDGKILRVDDSRSAPMGMAMMNLIYPLHTGEWTGVPGRILQVLVGFAPGALFFTGFLMWWRRVVVRRLRPRRPGRAMVRPELEFEEKETIHP